MRVDDGLSDVATLTWPFVRRVPAVTRPARGDGRSAGPPARSPLRSAAAGAKASLSSPPAAPPGSWPPDSRRLSQPLLAAAARPWVTLDDVTSADTWRRPIETQERSRALKLSQWEEGSAPQHVCSATGPGRRQILGPARHPVCDIPNRLLRYALIEVAWSVVPQSTHILRQTWLTRITGRPLGDPRSDEEEGGGWWVGQVFL